MVLETKIQATIVAGVDQNSFRKGIDVARDTGKKLDEELRVKLELDVANFQIQLGNARKALRDAKKSGDEDATINAQLKTNELQRGLTEAKRQLNNYVNTGDKDLSRLQSKFNNVGSTIGNQFKMIGTQMKAALTSFFGIGLILGALSSIKNFLSSSTEDAIAFESAFAGVKKTLNASEAEFSALRKELEGLSEEIPIAFEELSRIAELGGQLGVGIGDITKFTDTIAKIAVTTNLTAEEAATSFARIANVTGLPLSEIDRLGSVVVELGNNFATTEKDIVEFTQRIAAAGTIAGLTPPQIAAIGTSLSAVGINAEAGGTAVSKALIDINTAVAQSNSKLAGFAKTSGLTATEFSKLWETDAAGAFEKFVEGLGKEGDSAVNTIDELLGANTRTRAAFLSLALDSTTLSEALSSANGEFEINTALQIEAAKRFATTASQIDLLTNRLRVQRAEVGESTKGFKIFWLTTQLYITTAINAISNAFTTMEAFVKRTLARVTVVAVEQIQFMADLMAKVGLLSDNFASNIDSKLNRIKDNANRAIKENSKEAVSALISQKASTAALEVAQEDYNTTLDNTTKSYGKVKDAEDAVAEAAKLVQKEQEGIEKHMAKVAEETKKNLQEKGVAYIKAFDDAIKDSTDNIKKLQDELGKVGEELGGVEQDIGKRAISIEKELAGINVDIASGDASQEDLDKKVALERELALARANINQELLDELKRQDQLSETEKLLERQTALLARQTELISELAFEEEQNRLLKEKKELFSQEITKTYKIELQKQTAALAEEAAKQIALYNAIAAAARAAASAGGISGGGGTIPGRAIGGPVSGGSPYIVGERGPELFVPGSSGNIVPNNTLNNNININANVSNDIDLDLLGNELARKIALSRKGIF